MATPSPEDLPVPEDDGKCDHLVPGTPIPPISLPATDGSSVNLSTLSGSTVLYCYPRTGKPEVPLPDGWALIPGAMGCKLQTCSFKNHLKELQKLGVTHVFGLSTQDTAYQAEAWQRLHLPFNLLSDEKREFIEALNLPTFEAPECGVLVKRVTLVIKDGVVLKVFYPVFPADKSAEIVVEWVKKNKI
ncbi:Peroxiredoxin Q, chloroplastic [Folsomia candida]|uniref:Peroxiredoxin-5, mitochondrial n=2 Tax=Folsomia candida TaxID=158441 RepID=A0A226DBL8_FOLCA|nr:Peroxiredoxin Q, chloroplastic [Folsomia candida]